MLLENMSKEDLVELFKDQLLKCEQNISINKTIKLKYSEFQSTMHFTKGHVYLTSQDEGGHYIKDDNGRWLDVCELIEYGKIDMEKVFVNL